MKGEDIRYSFIKLNKNNCSLLSRFTCGNEQIDIDIKSKALYNSQMTTFLVLRDDNTQDVICIYSLSCSGYIYNMHEKFYIYPAVEIKYFAVNKKYQDLKFSDNPEDGCISNMILYSVINQIIDFTDNYCGADKIILYSTKEGVPFYTKCGFESFTEYMLKSDDRYLDGCTPMYMSF